MRTPVLDNGPGTSLSPFVSIFYFLATKQKKTGENNRRITSNGLISNGLISNVLASNVLASKKHWLILDHKTASGK